MQVRGAGGRPTLEDALPEWQPIGRPIEPAEIGQSVAFLLSDASRAITGTAFVVDGAYLSPFYQRDSISVSICGHKYLDNRGFLADVARTLDPFDPRPHWGKIHYMDRQRLQAAFPEYDRFLGIREKLDPSGAFLGPHLSGAFG